jgi:hypothetical protein
MKITTFAPFYGFGWSILIKRIVEFKEEVFGSKKTKPDQTQTSSINWLPQTKTITVDYCDTGSHMANVDFLGVTFILISHVFHRKP